MRFDVKIVGGLIHDGDGGAPVSSNIGINDGVIAEIGDCAGEARKTIDAKGCIVTPGFIDLHTHYDGQISWDEELRPSVNHGVTTAIMGNCGVGFAPVKKQDHDRLVRLMEGVEDIPGTALHEGLTWNWESFPEYMNAIDAIPHTIDFGVMVPHDPVRVYVMGERATSFDEASTDEIDQMRAIVREGLEAGAAGFALGRTDIHKTADGEWTPSADASRDELVGLAKAFDGIDHGVMQIVSDFDLEREGDQFKEEFSLIEDFVRVCGRPASLTCVQRDLATDQWRDILRETERLNDEGLPFNVQVAPRAIGVFQGLQCTFHPLIAQPSYIEIKDLPLEERLTIMQDPAFKKKCLSEKAVKVSGAGSSIPPIVDTLIAAVEMVAYKFFRLGDPPNYEQTQEQSLGAEAKRDGVSALEKIYDTLLELDGRQLIYLPFHNYVDFNLENVREMLVHPNALPGLSDGGAHVGTVCDASFPTYLLSHWSRDRDEGKIDLERTVQMLTADSADYLGLTDRGRLSVGKRADINVIDFDNLTLGMPEMVKDLPAGGQRLIQPVKGYRATLVAGETVIENDALTGARPGRLVRFG